MNLIRYKSLLPGIGALIITLSSCVDEKVIADPSQLPENDVYSNEYSIGFKMKLDKSLNTREGGITASSFSNTETYYDNYIDTQDKCRFFFFTEDGQFLFGANDRIVTSVAESSDYTHNTWYVRIPMTMIIDRKGNEFPIDDIKTFLKHNKFKVAVLANWPNEGDKINPGDYDDSEENSTSSNPSSTLKGYPQWGWDESVLNPIARTNGKVKNINDLHHVYPDKTYTEAKGGTYDFMLGEEMEGSNGTYKSSGEPSDWVQMKDLDTSYDENGAWKASYNRDSSVPPFENRETANAWIRANWDPTISLNEIKGIYRHYQHLWYLWNFDASYKYGKWLESNTTSSNQGKQDKANEYFGDNFGWDDGTQTSLANPRGLEWYNRNGSTFYPLMKTSYNNGGTAKDLANMTIESVSNDDSGKPFFRYNKISKGVVVRQTGMTNVENGKTYSECYGLSLPSRGSNTKASETTEGVICFRPRTAGTLRIKWSNPSSTTAAKLYIQKNGDKAKEYTIEANNTKKIYDMGGTSSPDDVVYHLSMEGNSFPMYIYCSSGNAIIYSIEYIRGKYLYDTDRVNIAPSEDKGIPMYGVQLFNPIGDWEYGTTYDLSPDETVGAQNLTLIRSLAKIELFVPKSFSNAGHRPEHVYMRSFNRSARCEPMDVETPTYLLWNDVEGHNKTGNTYNCEFFSVQKYGAAYNNSKSNTDWLKWFYGSWKNATWHVEGSMNENMIWTKTRSSGWSSINVNTGSGLYTWGRQTGDTYPYINDDFPHIFNPNVNRSDFCEFLYAGEVGENYRYVMYMPEKNIDDPTTVGDMTSTPKVAHIEFRYSSEAGQYACSEFNLDDDDCFRIYFTNYGSDSLTDVNPDISGIGKSGWGAYEKTNSIANYHWPVMRNHKYQFYLGGSPETPTVEVKVGGWGHEKIVVDW